MNKKIVHTTHRWLFSGNYSCQAQASIL